MDDRRKRSKKKDAPPAKNDGRPAQVRHSSFRDRIDVYDNAGAGGAEDSRHGGNAGKRYILSGPWTELDVLITPGHF